MERVRARLGGARLLELRDGDPAVGAGREVGVERARVSVDAAVLARYEGRYAFSAGSRTVAGFMGMNHTVTLVDGRLYLNALPLIPLSATMFESTGAIAEFFLDANGAVTRLVLGQTEGEAVYTPRK